MTEITVQIVTTKGNETKKFNTDEALSFIKDQCNNHNKWVYLDGELKNISVLEPEDLEDATDILLLSALAGGNCR